MMSTKGSPSALVPGIIILAAGNSSRMGSPKQLLPWQRKPLLRFVTEVALSIYNAPVVVVLGANEELIRPSLDGLPITIVKNADWAEGMASSIRCGLDSLIQLDPEIQAALFLVCDQPFVSPALLTSIIHQWVTNEASIVASSYQDAAGVPTLLASSLFPELLALKGTEGARRVIQRHQGEVITVPFAEGALDWDTPDDVRACLN
jgi:molybdenum cofactor cytidylyltransferase